MFWLIRRLMMDFLPGWLSRTAGARPWAPCQTHRPGRKPPERFAEAFLSGGRVQGRSARRALDTGGVTRGDGGVVGLTTTGDAAGALAGLDDRLGLEGTVHGAAEQDEGLGPDLRDPRLGDAQLGRD